MKFLLDKLRTLAGLHKMEFQHKFEARQEGYYAAHCYIIGDFAILSKLWGTDIRKIKIELQITTQLQDVIRRILHEHYERRRQMISESSEEDWKWDHQSNEFATNYLGHILHFLEGMIVEIRDKKKEAKNEERIF